MSLLKRTTSEVVSGDAQNRWCPAGVVSAAVKERRCETRKYRGPVSDV